MDKEAMIADIDWLKSQVAGSKEYYCVALSTGGTTAIGATEKQLVFSTTIVNSDPTLFSLASNRLTINKTGYFHVEVDVGIGDASGNASTWVIYVKKNTTELGAGRSYISIDNRDQAQSATISIDVNVTSGDYLSLYAIRVLGSSTTGFQANNGTRLTVTER